MPQLEPPYLCSPQGVDKPLLQTEIISGLVQAHLNIESVCTDQDIVDRKEHPFSIVLTQDCDLDKDFLQRNSRPPLKPSVPNILFCEMSIAETMRAENSIDSRSWRRVQNHNDERYHLLEALPIELDALGQGLPQLGMDFKRCFTLPTDEVYKRIERGEAKRRCFLKSPYLEHLCFRFSHFLARVALPETEELPEAAEANQPRIRSLPPPTGT